MVIDPSKPFDLAYIVEAHQIKMRLDRFLCMKIPAISRTRMQRYIQGGRVWVNGQLGIQNERMRPGDQVVLKCTVPEGGVEVARMIPLEILYEDDSIVALNKQSGLVVHPVALHRHDTLLNAVYYRYQGKLREDQEIALANRIDKMTSGVVLVTKDVASKRDLQEQFEGRTVAKTYLAFVLGRILLKEQEITLSIGPAKKSQNRCLMAIREDKEGKPCSTAVTVLESFTSPEGIDITLVRVSPKTGRQHQIRVHMAAIGNPLVADHLYGNKCGFRWQNSKGENEEINRFALHAEKLTIRHPVSKEPLTLIAQPPRDFVDFGVALSQGLPLQLFSLNGDEEEAGTCFEEESRKFSHTPIGDHEYDDLSAKQVGRKGLII